MSLIGQSIKTDKTMTVKELIASQGWEVMKTNEINEWAVVNGRAFHVISATCSFPDYLLIEVDKFATSAGNVISNNRTEVLTDKNEDHVTLCNSFADAMLQVKEYEVAKEAEQTEGAEKILAHLDAFCSAYDSCEEYDVYRKVQEIIKKEKTTRFSVLNKLLLDCCDYYSSDDEYVLNDDEQHYLRQVFGTRKISFKNTDKNGIITCINIDHIVSVNTYVTIGGKDAICFTMDNGNEFRIYKEDDGRIFKVLTILFG